MGINSQQIAKNFAFPVRKSTPAVLTNLSYKQHLKKFVEIFSSLFLSPAHHQFEAQDCPGWRSVALSQNPAWCTNECHLLHRGVLCTVHRTHPWFFCSEVFTPAPAKTHPERYRSTLRKCISENCYCDISQVHNSAARERLFAKANLWIYITRDRKLESFVLVCESKSWVSFH